MSNGAYQRIAPQAREVAEQLEPDEDDIATGYLNPLRKLCSRTEDRLEDEDFKEERTGTECIGVRTWKDRVDEVRDRHLFFYLLRDSVETHLVFYRKYHGFAADERDAFIEKVKDGNTAGSEKTILQVWEWLKKIDAPTELEYRQQTLETVTQQGVA